MPTPGPDADMTDPTERARALLRFVPRSEWKHALDAMNYAAAMLGPAASLTAIETWCYELAAEGVPYQDWPEMVALRHARGAEDGTNAALLERARRTSEAMGMVDYGEI